VTTLLVLLIAGQVFALFMLIMTLMNLSLWPRPGKGDASTDLVSVCIPARNEERNIREVVESLLAQDHAAVEVLVYDDQSVDATGRIVAELAARDARVRIVPSVALPAGWNGKQHACWRMSHAAKGAWMLFTDADVRFSRDCVSRTLATAKGMNAPLLSGFPRQIVASLAEKLTVPMIFFILLGYLPFARMRTRLDPSASAGCGQFLFVRRDAYDASGGHEGFKASMHDGIRLPRAVRRAGFRSDLFDCTDLCECRMYFGWGSAWRGFAKNAYEGLGNPFLLVFVTAVHALTALLPVAVLLAWSSVPAPMPALAASCLAMAFVQRVIIHRRVRLPAWVVALHPVAIVVMTAIQWHSFVLHLTGRRTWRGRAA
jgi:cellulose synthase/poly-beta-1,6-N-acetylglucosamine synthase-like glycosyltransferase